jgi:sulfoxide reductase heme-binding subunit YedZ
LELIKIMASSPSFCNAFGVEPYHSKRQEHAAPTIHMTTQRNLKKSDRYWIWAALAVPAMYILGRYLNDSISYGQVIHDTGNWSVGLLALALAVTPLRRVLPEARWPRRIMTHRRALGVASFAYAAFHLLTYLQRKWGYGYILKEGVEADLLTGWIALVIFTMLAITSNDKSVRMLRKNWQRLHRTVYVAAGLVFAHWILTALERQTAYICLAALCLVEALRFLRSGRSAA